MHRDEREKNCTIRATYRILLTCFLDGIVEQARSLISEAEKQHCEIISSSPILSLSNENLTGEMSLEIRHIQVCYSGLKQFTNPILQAGVLRLLASPQALF
jgi:hypothetical protein